MVLTDNETRKQFPKRGLFLSEQLLMVKKDTMFIYLVTFLAH